MDDIAFPKKRRKVPQGVDSESSLQKFVDDYLALRNVYNFRIADGFWGWLSWQRGGAVSWFRRMFGGMPDNLCIKPLDDKHCLAMCLELKSRRGSLHGRQKADSRSLPWIVCRTPEEAQQAIDNFIERTVE